jgi:hypothetical protein
LSLEEEEEEKNSEEYEVEKVIDKKDEKGEKYYLVKWKGYDSSANTWEPLENLIHCRERIKEFESERWMQENRQLLL